MFTYKRKVLFYSILQKKTFSKKVIFYSTLSRSPHVTDILRSYD